MERRTFIKALAGGGAALHLIGTKQALAQLPGGSLNVGAVARFSTALLIPPVMPKAGTLLEGFLQPVDYYEIAMRQFKQQILPAGMPATTVWSYGPAATANWSAAKIFHAPSLTIEATANRPVRVKWINDLVDGNGNYLPHLLPVDQTLHWANPGGGRMYRDSRPTFTSTPKRYQGPVPLVTHVHGAVGVGDESDGYTEAWYLPDACNIPNGYATKGKWYDFFATKAFFKYLSIWEPGSATFEYPNKNRASTLWYHDHALGLTRLNVYAGGAGFYIVRGGSAGDSAVKDSRTGSTAVLPGPAPKEGDASGKTYYEIPIAIQDRAFNSDGSLFYPDTRAFFDGINGPYIPYTDVPPIWNPEFFGNTMMVNGNTWPFLKVEKRRYRLRLLNGCQGRFLILDFSNIPGVEVWQIGNEGGFLAAPVNMTASYRNRLLICPAERADVIVDFTNVPQGNYTLLNVGPDAPYGGGDPGTDFDPADPATTGQVMQFRVGQATSADSSTHPAYLRLPSIKALPTPSVTRKLSLNEMMSMKFPGASVSPMLGTISGDPAGASGGVWTMRMWNDAVTENPAVGATEVWELYNTTADAHPMHIHETVFEVVNRQAITVDAAHRTVKLVPNTVMAPQPWEKGLKDTVIANPGQVTRIKAQFPNAGQFVWHCHIVEHEDNEMMRPFRIGDYQWGQPE